MHHPGPLARRTGSTNGYLSVALALARPALLALLAVLLILAVLPAVLDAQAGRGP